MFQLDSTHELYGHMNVNYLRLPAVPSFDHWSDALAVLAHGDYFTTTGEVLLPKSRIFAKGDELTAQASVTWTFPLRMAEVVWGDGRETHRETIPLTDTAEFNQHDFTWKVTAPGWTWARLAVWDVAGNGAFTTPVWKN